ncbi:methylated-DNA--[protein]-cysteine S-methyltransferase [Demequina sp. SO4-18]|uniref:methylated-DNA--[protein]-cysteine S-methyltransferase n=1 Tax=Demequina sp. SO4-18 TaxID=3401026 RepID=UPI003B59EE25
MNVEPLVSCAHETQFGELHVLVTPEDGVVRAAGFRPLRDVASGLRADLARRGWRAGDAPDVAHAVEQWLEGDADAITAIPVEQPGGPFFQEVWEALRTVPGGEVVSYGELAEMAGRPRAMRAVGTACARNGIAPFVPCHRVIQSGGRLGSYGFGGMAVKAAMLEHEGFAVASASPDAPVTAAR